MCVCGWLAAAAAAVLQSIEISHRVEAQRTHFLLSSKRITQNQTMMLRDFTCCNRTDLVLVFALFAI